MIFCKLGHSIGRAATIGATIAVREVDELNVMFMVVVLGERNRGIKEMDFPATKDSSRVFRFGNKGSLMAQSCRTEKTSKDRMFKVQSPLSSRILRAYFRKRTHSSVVGDLLKDFKSNN